MSWQSQIALPGPRPRGLEVADGVRPMWSDALDLLETQLTPELVEVDAGRFVRVAVAVRHEVAALELPNPPTGASDLGADGLHVGQGASEALVVALPGVAERGDATGCADGVDRPELVVGEAGVRHHVLDCRDGLGSSLGQEGVGAVVHGAQVNDQVGHLIPLSFGVANHGCDQRYTLPYFIIIVNLCC